MNSLWRAIGLGGSSIPNFEFTIDETAPAISLSADALLPWVMRPATRESDGIAVTVFSINLAGRDQNSTEMARNVLKRCKTLMLPGFLRTYDATEYKDSIYIATESVVPLQSVISNDSAKIEFYEEASGEKYNNAVALGLKYVAQALNAIHKHNLVHGNIGAEEVFVTKGGEWKLFGLELVSQWNEEHSLLKRNAGLLPEYRRVAVQAEAVNVYDIDAWGIGCLIYTVFSSSAASANSKSIKVADMRACRTMPRTLQSAFMSLTSTNPKMRMSFGKFLEECEFITGSAFVQMVGSLENLAVMDAVDRDNLYRTLTTQLDDVPLCACKHIVLSKLLTALSFGGGTASVLEPILKIGARLPEEEFSTHVGPIVTNMFASTDHLVRCRLLSSSSQYVRLLPKELVNEKIYPQYQTGFASRHADIRELTVRALVDFAPLLNERILTNDIPRHIGVLQQDREGPIRTNATICLSMIASSLPESVRGKTLVSGFGRMLKDPFVPSRAAAIKSICGTIEMYSPQQLGELLLPAIAPCAVDAHAEVREAALSAISAVLAKLTANHKTMPMPSPSAAAEGGGTAQTSPSSALSSTGVAAPVAAVVSDTTSAIGGLLGGFFGGSTVKPTPTPVSPIATNTNTNTTAAAAAAPTSSVVKPQSLTRAAASAASPFSMAAGPSSSPSPSASAPSKAAKGSNNGWGDDDDDMWGGGAASSSAPTTSSSASAAAPSAGAAPSAIRKPQTATAQSSSAVTAQQQLDDFFGTKPAVVKPTATAGGSSSSNGGTYSGIGSGLGVGRPAAAGATAGGAMKLGGARKMGLGGASKAE